MGSLVVSVMSGQSHSLSDWEAPIMQRTPQNQGSEGVLAECLNTCSYITTFLPRNLS